METANKGFEIILHEYERILSVCAWGCWDEDFIRKYQHALAEKLEEIGSNGESWSVLVDLSDCVMFSEEILSSIETLTRLSVLDLQKIACIHKYPTIQMTLRQGMGGAIQSDFTATDEAITWLLQEHGSEY